MAEIRKLSQEVIGIIAAGEVVERPASVVKELVENSIDAGATSVTVELKGGGIEYIRISDNGKGIPSGQIRLAFERHATSKLQTGEQLYDLRTLGFRGEALASVAAVSKVSCTTRNIAEDFGVKCKVEGGNFVNVTEAASPVGTTFVVEELFYNTPVRRKFLKKPATEAGFVADYMLRLILSHPEISFRFVNQGKTVYHSIGDGKVESALFALYGKDAFKQMIPVSGNEGGVLISGYVGVGELCRGNRQQQSFFINGRYFRSGLLSRALESGCEGRAMIGKFPMCALFLEMPYHLVDVNVHPNKLEVRFQNEFAVADAVKHVVFDSLHRETLAQRLTAAPEAEDPAQEKQEEFKLVQPQEAAFPENTQTEETSLDKPAEGAVKKPLDHSFTVLNPEAAVDTPPPVSFRPFREPVSYSSALHSSYVPKVVAAAPPIEPEKLDYAAVLRPETPPAAKPSAAAAPAQESVPAPIPEQKQDQTAFLQQEQHQLKLVGIVFDTYWIFETGDRLLLVDQHAAHERILYDRMLAQYASANISQQLLSPRLVELSPADMALVEETNEFFASTGFQVELFDETSVALQAVPTLFGMNEDPKTLFLEALDAWRENRSAATAEKMQRQVAQMACKHAIKGGDHLNEEEVRLFLSSMLESDSMPTCPHGRPIVTEMTKYQLEKRFKRA